MLTQRYKKFPITVRDQLKQLFVWFPKESTRTWTHHHRKRCWILGCWIYQGAIEKREARLPLFEARTSEKFSNLNKYIIKPQWLRNMAQRKICKTRLTTLTGGLAIVNFSLKALEARPIFGNTIENYGKLYGWTVAIRKEIKFFDTLTQNRVWCSLTRLCFALKCRKIWRWITWNAFIRP